jgi:twinkle protein
MTPKEIAQRMAGDVEAVCRHLLPGGQQHGHEWCAGSVSGGEGQSLKVRLSGAKAGVWKDFADSGKGGDLIDLWRQCRNLSMGDAIRECKAWCGIKDEGADFYPKRGTHQFPKVPKGNAPDRASAVIEWFAKRGITAETVALFDVRADGPVAIFPCYVGDEVPLWKFRDIANGKKIWASADSAPVLFGWQAVPEDARTVVITEGEPDAMAVRQEGFPALSVPFGAGKGAKQAWIENEYDRMERFDTLYVWTDADKEGDAAADEIMDRLGRHRCLRVRCEHKDANDLLMAGGHIANAIAAAKAVDPHELRAADSFLPEVMEQFFPTGIHTTGAALPWEKVNECFRLRPGEVTIWTGYNGHGKTLMLDHVAVHGMANEARWCIASMEMAAPVHLKRMFRQIITVLNPNEETIGICNEWLRDKAWLFNVRGTAKAARIIEVFRYAWRKYGIDQFVVDSLAKCGFAEDDYNGQKGFVESLCDFAGETKTHVHLVTHARKGQNEDEPPGKLDVRGAAAITDMADNVVTVWRNKGKGDSIAAGADPAHVAHEPDAKLIVSKQRNHGWEGAIILWLDQDSGQFVERGKKHKLYLQWGARK